MILTNRTAALLCASFCLASPALAQAPPDAETVVVTGVATPTEKAKIGASLSIITGDVIEAQGYDYVSDALRQIPGLSVNRAGAPGALTQLRIRGAEGNHTLVLLDGVDISNPDQGETDLSTLLSGDIERIEVLRGPQSGLYGSNALAGVVNIITNRQVNGHYGSAELEGGEQNTAQMKASVGAGDGASYVSGGFQARISDGYDISADRSALGVPAVGAGGKAGDKEGDKLSTVYLRGGAALSPVFRVDGFLNYLHKDSDSDGQAFSPPISGRTYDDASMTRMRRWIAAASGKLELMDGRWVTVLRGSWQDEERRGDGTNFPFSGPITPAVLAAVTLDPTGADATRAKGTLESTLTFGEAAFLSHLTGFFETRRETFRNAFPSPFSPLQADKQSRNLMGAGLQYRAEIADQVFASAAYRHDDNGGDFKDADTWSVQLAWAVPNIGLRPHASYGTGVTNPTFVEQFGFDPGSFVGNPNLKPEEATGWDVGLEQSLFDGRLTADVTYFESTLKHEIFTQFGSAPLFISTAANATGKSDRSGWEVSLSARPIDDVDVAASYTKLDATEPLGVETRRPKDQASFDGSWRVMGGPLRVNLGVTYNGDQYDTDFATFLPTRQDAYTLVRLGASWAVSDRVEIFGRVENLTDEDYEEVIAFRGAPRAAFVGVRFRESQTK